jgi:predicted ATPase
MIIKLTINNWKSYHAAELNIDPISVLIGTNASGKSNALDALQFLHRLSMNMTLTSALKGEGIVAGLRGGVEWAARKPENKFSLSLTCRAEDLTEYEHTVQGIVFDGKCELFSEQLIRRKFKKLKNLTTKEIGKIILYKTDSCEVDTPTITARLYNGKQGSPKQLNKLTSVLSQLSTQNLNKEIEEGVLEILNDTKKIFVLDPIPSHMRGFSELSDSIAPDAKNIAGVLAALAADKKLTIQQSIVKYAKHLPEKDIKSISAETVGKFNQDAMLYCEESWEGQETSTVDARGMSDGTLRFIAIMTALLTRPKNSLLVIEEVDNGLHPSRADLLLKMIREVGAQQSIDILVTTHNPALLDAMGLEMIPFITIASRDNNGFSVLTLLEDISTIPKLLAKTTIGRLMTNKNFSNEPCKQTELFKAR